MTLTRTLSVNHKLRGEASRGGCWRKKSENNFSSFSGSLICLKSARMLTVKWSPYCRKVPGCSVARKRIETLKKSIVIDYNR